jgi:hypothetical protein
VENKSDKEQERENVFPLSLLGETKIFLLCGKISVVERLRTRSVAVCREKSHFSGLFICENVTFSNEKY